MLGRTLMTALIFTASFAVAAADGAAVAGEEGWVPLFDGKTLDGWHTTGNWVVEENGVVALHPRPGESGWERFDDYLISDRKYGDFVLDIEFKILERGETGVFLRAADPKNPSGTGFEVQILATHGKEELTAHDCGGIISTVAPSKNMMKPAGEWNRYVITCQGPRLKVELNGEQVVDLDMNTTHLAGRMEGHIMLQDESTECWYRNARIKELKPAE